MRGQLGAGRDAVLVRRLASRGDRRRRRALGGHDDAGGRQQRQDVGLDRSGAHLRAVPLHDLARGVDQELGLRTARAEVNIHGCVCLGAPPLSRYRGRRLSRW